MELALAKIRPHSSSSLPHQKAPAILLRALEATFREQNTETTPTAYYAGLLTTLESTLHKKDTGMGDGDVLPAELYLLSLVIPFVSPNVIRAHLSTVLSLTAPLFPTLMPHAPPLRSHLTIYHTLLLSLDRSQLETQGIRQSFASILQLCLDPRPKVRKKACGVVRDVLATPPPPMMRHPYADQVAEWTKSALAEATGGGLPRSKSSGKITGVPSTETAIHVLAFLRPVLQNFPSSALPSITNLLLTLPRLGNPFLSQQAYDILSELFSAPTEGDESAVSEQVSGALRAALSSPPSKSDGILAPAWLNVLGNAMIALSAINPEACAVEVAKVWKAVWQFFDSTDVSVRKAAADSLSLLSRCFTTTLIDSAIHEVDGVESTSTLSKIITQVTNGLDSLAFAPSIPELLTVISSLIFNLRSRTTSTSPTATESLLLPLIQKVGDLRIQNGFEYKELADSTLAMAMRVVGPEVLLRVLPLNLEPSDRAAGREPRAFLLPLLSRPHPSRLGHFVAYFVPMSERMFDLQQAAESNGRQSEAKVWSVLVSQIWTGLAGYCYATADLKEVLTPEFSQLLSQLLYSQPELRPAVLKALKVMVESNVAICSGGLDRTDDASDFAFISPEDAAKNVKFLETHVESWLAVLFNVFSSMEADNRGMVGDVISVWAAIADRKELTKAYGKVAELFKQRIASSQTGPANNNSNDTGNLTSMTQDLLILLLPYLSSDDTSSLFQLCLTSDVLGCKDNGVQKRGYKILAKIVERRNTSIDAEDVLSRLDTLGDELLPAAKKDRFNLLCLLIPLLRSTALHMIPSLIPEAVLGTKEPSEKTRGAAFDVIVALGEKMSEGGMVKRNMIDGMDEDDAENSEATASVDEYMTMVSGGLAGASPHMISATVTAISRLVFEFKETISSKMQTEIFTTMLVFLTSANREIVKSILGFIKLAIHTLPKELIRPHLKQLVPLLLDRSHDHKNHFKAKVRHIFERMLRRFDWDEVYGCAGDEEAAKVLINIKKRKERAKRKKARGELDEDDDDNEASTAKPAGGNAFEDVLYGSESELDGSDDDDRPAKNVSPSSKQKGGHFGARLRVDDDEPTDLLRGAASHITNAQSSRRRKPGQEAAHFKVDDDTGKMIIDEASEAEATGAQGSTAMTDVAGTAYRENITAVDGFTRGPGGRVKFNKDTKKRRRENADDDDVEMADGDVRLHKNTKPKVNARFGHEYKAKKAGGDIKKGGLDPYAYMTLSEAAKRRGKRQLGIAGT